MKNMDFMNFSDYLSVNNNRSWFFTSILYASYNSILLIPALITIKNYILKLKDIKYISIIVTAVSAILLVIVFLFLVNVDVNIKELEMPAVYAINNIWPSMKAVYGIIILISIFTTAISLGISFLNNVAGNKKSYDVVALLICASSVIFSNFGFSNLVNLMYPVLGVLGLVQIVQILKLRL